MDPIHFVKPAVGTPVKCRHLQSRTIDAYGFHFTCDCPSMKGGRARRHNIANSAATEAIASTGTTSTVIKEPHMVQLCDRKPGLIGPDAVVDARADIAVTFSRDSKRFIIDTTIAAFHPTSTVPGAGALKAAKAKTDNYNKCFCIDPRELVIFAMDHTGRLIPQARNMIRDIASRSSALTDISGDYARTIIYFYQRVSVALQKGNALMLSSTLACGGLPQ